MTIAELFVLTQILGAVFWLSIGYRIATYARHKRNSLMRFTIEATCRAAKEAGHNEPRPTELLDLLDMIQRAPDRKVLTASYASIRFEWRPDAAD